MPANAAFRAFDEARELFYAANLAYRATGDPYNAVPLLRRSLILLLGSVAATRGVTSTDRNEVLSAVRGMEDRDWVLRFPVLQELERLDDLDARFTGLGERATEDESRALRRLIDAMPSLLSSVRGHLLREGLPEARLDRRRRIRRAAFGVAVAVAVAGTAYAAKRAFRSAYQAVTFAGLHGAYFGDTNFSTIKETRNDPNIDFDWASGSPGHSIPTDGFSVRWTGKLQIPVADTYTFYLASDDGARLYIEDRLVVDNWGEHDYVEMPGTIRLSAGTVSVRVEYFDNIGRAAVRLSWSTFRRPKAIVAPEFFVR